MNEFENYLEELRLDILKILQEEYPSIYSKILYKIQGGITKWVK